MKANQLRVGNLLDYKNGNITTLAIEDFAEIAHNDDFLKLIKPILLTEEWLVKFGFKCHWDEDYDNHIFTLTTDSDDMIIEGDWISQTEFRNLHVVEYKFQLEVKVDYVHQLQNLYFALTGEELKFN